jgi:hypothetical protein
MTAGPERGQQPGERGTEHEELHVLLGAFVLGGLDPEDHRAFTRHLRSCQECQREAAQLSGLPAMLDLVEPSEVLAVPFEASSSASVGEGATVLVPRGLLQRVRADRRRRRWRIVAAAAVLAVLAGGIGAAIGPVMSRLNAPATRGLVAVAAPAASGQSSAARVEIDLVTRTWGTQLDLRGSSLPAGQVLYLAVTDKEGHSYDVASWTGTPSGRATLSAACWMKSDDIATVKVRTRTGEAVATANT